MGHYRRRRRSRAVGGTNGVGALILIVLLAAIYAILYGIAIGIDCLIETIGAMPTYGKTILFILLVIFLALYIRRKWQIAKIRRKKQEEERIKEQEEQKELETNRRWERETIEGMKAMHHRDFEYYIAEQFTKLGYICKVTQGTGDGGKDIEMRCPESGALSLTECKRYKDKKVGRPEIQKFHSAMIHMRAQKVFFVTTSGFTNEAANYVRNKNITLIDGETLVKMKAKHAKE